MSRDWVLLPPAFRPVVFALSAAVVALAVWDQFRRTEVIPQAESPVAPVDLRGRLAPPDASPHAAGRPTEFAEGSSTPTAAPMAEEERSRRNEEYMAGLEKEKRSMGISAVLPRRTRVGAPLASNTPVLVSGPGRRVGKRPSYGGTPGERRDYAAGIPSDDAGLVFTDGGSLASSWTLLGLPGNYPAVDYGSRRAVLLKRSSTKILEVRVAPDAVQVYFRLLDPEEASDPAKDRFATLPLEPKPVSLILLPRADASH